MGLFEGPGLRSKAEPEIADLGGRERPPASPTPKGKGGGRTPDPFFRGLWGGQGAVWTHQKIDDLKPDF